MAFAAAAISVLVARAVPEAANDAPVLDIEIRDYALVPRADMDRAVAEVNDVFEQAGIRAKARVDRRSFCDGRAGASLLPGAAVRVYVYPRIADDVVSPNFEVLGLVPGADRGGRLAYVFADRIAIAARRSGGFYGRVLGFVIAHEVGHVLLRGRAHAATGIMRPACDRRQIRSVMLGEVAFESEEAATIKALLEPPPS